MRIPQRIIKESALGNSGTEDKYTRTKKNIESVLDLASPRPQHHKSKKRRALTTLNLHNSLKINETPFMEGQHWATTGWKYRKHYRGPKASCFCPHPDWGNVGPSLVGPLPAAVDGTDSWGVWLFVLL